MDRGGQSGGESGTRRSRKPARLGDLVERIMAERISPLHSRFGAVGEVWSSIVPRELLEHCEIIDVTGGRMKVQVDSPSYMYEFQLCSSVLLAELKAQCPEARLVSIKFVAG